MAFTIPDQGEGDSNLQSVCYQEDWDIMAAGVSGSDCVISGCAVTGGTDMTPAVAKGAVLSNGTLFAVAAADVTIGPADGTNPRIDLIVVNSSGALAVRAGTAAASPKPPVRTANDVVLYQVFVPASTTQITQARCIDKRVFRTQGPIKIASIDTRVTVSNDSAVTTIHGITIPNGMFISGRKLRWKGGGNVLANVTSPSVAWSVDYGGAAIWNSTFDFTQSSSRYTWDLDFVISAQANADQRLQGTMSISAITAPTTGAGDLGATAVASTPIGGDGTIDSDAGNNDLRIRVDMDATSASFDVRLEYATLELL